ncbi:MAG TPA: ATP-binding cassette domain-containing protein [Bryobacterales bacterium]|nr:ATP-binding cassette domain-containing protein [Bryobacterales bacterium]
MTATPAIEVDRLVFRYGQRTALEGVSFQVSPAAIFGLLGPNGGGKTTLFRILSTLLVPAGGAARVFGLDVALEPHAVRRRIGVVFQAPSVDKKLTAMENLVHQGHLYGLRGAALQQRAREALERVGMAERAGDRVETLSGGMQRRIELAKGLLHGPDLLLLDEPSAALDPGGRRDLWEYLTHLRDSQRVTVLVTTHLLEEAERCDRLAILDGGRLVAEGTPEELKRKIGGDVIVVGARDPEALRRQVEERFGLTATTVDGTVRIERERGHEFIAQLVEAFPGQIDSVSVSKPTLEDVFIHQTGHRLWE